MGYDSLPLIANKWVRDQPAHKARNNNNNHNNNNNNNNIFFSNLYLNLEPSLMNPTSLGGRSACESLKNEWCSTPTFQSLFVALKLASLKLSTVPP